jgi:hypothetical protein
MANVLLLLLMIGLVGYWAYSVATYDWTKFEEDSRGDDFLKPHDDKTV